MKDFLKKISVLALEINNADGFEAVEIFDKMEKCYQEHISEIKPKTTANKAVASKAKCHISEKQIALASKEYSSKFEKTITDPKRIKCIGEDFGNGIRYANESNKENNSKK